MQYNTQVNSIADIDQGLRQHFVSIFNYMTLALLISGFVSGIVGTTPAFAQIIWGTPLKWAVIFAPLAMSFYMAFKIESMSLQTAKISLAVFSALMGLSLSSIFLVFKLGSIVSVFFMAAATFGATALYGYTTKRDLSKMGTFLIMGVFALVIASVVNIFLASSVFQTVISVVALLVFTGLTAYDMQNQKALYYELDGEIRDKAGVMGALSLYMNFINIFTSLLNLFGERE